MDFADFRIRVQSGDSVPNARAVAAALDGVGMSAVAMETKSKGAFSRLRTSMNGFRANMAGMGLTLAAAFTFSTIRDFEKQMSAVRAVSGATGAEFDRLQEKAREMGRTTTFSAKQAADGMELLAQAGFKTNEIMSAIGPSLKLAQAGQLDMATATRIGTSVLKEFGLQAKDAAVTFDVLAKAAVESNANIRDMGTALTYVGPIANSLGATIEDTAGAIGVLSNSGMLGSMAGTGLRQVFLQLTNPTKKAQAAIKELGLTIEEVSPVSNSMVDIFKKFNAAGLDAAEAGRIFTSRTATAAITLSDNAAALENMTSKMYDATGALDTMSAIMTDNLDGAVKRLVNSLQDLILSTGDNGLTGMLKGLVTGMTATIQAMNWALPVTSAWSLGAYGLAVALKAAGAAMVGMAIGRLVEFLVTSIRYVFSLAAALRTATVAQEGFNLAAMKNPYIAIGAALATVAYAIYELSGANESAADSITKANQAITNADTALEKYRNTNDRATDAIQRRNRAEMATAAIELRTELKNLESQAKSTRDELAETFALDKFDAGLVGSTLRTKSYLATIGELGDKAQEAERRSAPLYDKIVKVAKDFEAGKASTNDFVLALDNYANSGAAGANIAREMSEELVAQSGDLRALEEQVGLTKNKQDELSGAMGNGKNAADNLGNGFVGVANQAYSSAEAMAFFAGSVEDMARRTSNALSALSSAQSGLARIEKEAAMAGMSATERAKAQVGDRIETTKAAEEKALRKFFDTSKAEKMRAAGVRPGTEAAREWDQSFNEAFSKEWDKRSKRYDTAGRVLMDEAGKPAGGGSRRSPGGSRRSAGGGSRSVSVEDTLDNRVTRIIDEVDPASAAYRKLEKDIRDLTEAQTLGLVPQEKAAGYIAALRARVEELGDPYEKMVKDLGTETEALKSTEEQRRLNAEVQDRLNQLRDKGRLLTEAEQQTLRSKISDKQLAEEKQSLTEAYNQYVGQLDPALEAQNQLESSQKMLTKAVNAGVISLDVYNNEMRRTAAIAAGDLTEALAQARREMEETFGARGNASRAAESYKTILQDIQGPMAQYKADLDAIKQLTADYPQLQGELNIRLQQSTQSYIEWMNTVGRGDIATGFLENIGRMIQGVENFKSQAGSAFGNFFSQLQDGLANGIGQALVFGGSLKKVFLDVARQAVASLISSLIKLGIQFLINATIGQAIRKAQVAAAAADMAAVTAAATASAGVVASAWAPAAAFVSLATFGANAGPAATALALTTGLALALAQVGKIGGLKDGGDVRGPGGPRDDRILSWLSNGEFVMNARATAENRDLLVALNQGVRLPQVRRADGGPANPTYVPFIAPSQGAPIRAANDGGSGTVQVSAYFETHIHTNDNSDPEEQADQFNRAVRPQFEAMVREVIQKEQRPGGMIANPKGRVN